MPASLTIGFLPVGANSVEVIGMTGTFFATINTQSVLSNCVWQKPIAASTVELASAWNANVNVTAAGVTTYYGVVGNNSIKFTDPDSQYLLMLFGAPAAGSDLRTQINFGTTSTNYLQFNQKDPVLYNIQPSDEWEVSFNGNGVKYEIKYVGKGTPLTLPYVYVDTGSPTDVLKTVTLWPSTGITTLALQILSASTSPITLPTKESIPNVLPPVQSPAKAPSQGSDDGPSKKPHGKKPSKSPTGSATGNQTLSTGAIIGISLAAAAVLFVIIFVPIFLTRKKRRLQ